MSERASCPDIRADIRLFARSRMTDRAEGHSGGQVVCIMEGSA